MAGASGVAFLGVEPFFFLCFGAIGEIGTMNVQTANCCTWESSKQQGDLLKY